MILMQGKGVSKGVINGKLYFFQRPDTTVAMRQVTDVEAEKRRLAQAQENAVQQLTCLAEKAREDAGIWIGICGELGADLSLLPTFLALGIDELSVTPNAVLPLRAAIRKSIAAKSTLEMLEC